MALHMRDAQLKHMNLSDAFRQGYVFQLTDGRLVFRTAYGQQNSVATKVKRAIKKMRKTRFMQSVCFSTGGWRSSGSGQSNPVFQTKLGHVYD